MGPATFDTDDNVAVLLRRVMASLGDHIGHGLKDNDLTATQAHPLFLLDQGLATTMADLARELHMDPGATTRLVDRLDAKGLCRRVRTAVDRRTVTVELTDAGRLLARRVPAVACAALNHHLAGFSREEWRHLMALLQRMRHNGDAVR